MIVSCSLSPAADNLYDTKCKRCAGTSCCAGLWEGLNYRTSVGIISVVLLRFPHIDEDVLLTALPILQVMQSKVTPLLSSLAVMGKTRVVPQPAACSQKQCAAISKRRAQTTIVKLALQEYRAIIFQQLDQAGLSPVVYFVPNACHPYFLE